MERGHDFRGERGKLVLGGYVQPLRERGEAGFEEGPP